MLTDIGKMHGKKQYEQAALFRIRLKVYGINLNDSQRDQLETIADEAVQADWNGHAVASADLGARAKIGRKTSAPNARAVVLKMLG